MSYQPTKKAGYSLIELLVVLAIVILIGVAGLPNIAGNDDRANLNQSANLIRQTLIDAKTRSQAPTKSDSSQIGQVYQVAFGKFNSSTSSTNEELPGDALSNTVSLEKGLARCDNGDLQSGFSDLNSYKLPRGIYISKFYPSNKKSTDSDTESVVRYSVGKTGFECGRYSNPDIKSTDFYNNGVWIGISPHLDLILARYLVIELSAQKVKEKRYVAVDRQTGEIIVGDANPQSYFTPTSDNLAPKWSALEPFQLSVACGATSSTVTISYPRALDRSGQANTTDPNLPVYYDINWDLGSGNFTPLALQYFSSLDNALIIYRFRTTAISTASQPGTIRVRLSANDQWGNAQPQNDPDSTLKWLEKNFSFNCGSVNSIENGYNGNVFGQDGGGTNIFLGNPV